MDAHDLALPPHKGAKFGKVSLKSVRPNTCSPFDFIFPVTLTTLQPLVLDKTLDEVRTAFVQCVGHSIGTKRGHVERPGWVL